MYHQQIYALKFEILKFEILEFRAKIDFSLQKWHKKLTLSLILMLYTEGAYFF